MNTATSAAIRSAQYLALFAAAAALVSCTSTPRPGTLAPRQGDEIIVAGQLFHTGARVVTWMDPGGYDAYRVERRFSPLDKAGWESSHAEVKDLDMPNRYNMRQRGLTDEEIERVRGGGWDLPLLQRVVDQFVLHYDACGTSRQCFKVLQDMRDLSVHFMLDLDGTIYQTLDVKERAWHATSSNSRSVGIEIAHIGAFAVNRRNSLAQWYAKDPNGQVRITVPSQYGNSGIRTKDFVGHPARPNLITGTIQGQALEQYDFTPQQYQALIRLTATLCRVLPQIKCDYPRDASGKLIRQKLPDTELNAYQGVLAHFHIQTNKVDPGPAFQWDYVIDNARCLLNSGMSPMAEEASQGHLRRRF